MTSDAVGQPAVDNTSEQAIDLETLLLSLDILSRHFVEHVLIIERRVPNTSSVTHHHRP